MINGLERVLLAAASPAAAARSYGTLLGMPVADAGEPPALQTSNVRLDFIPTIANVPEGLNGLCFAVGDLSKTMHLCERRGLRVHMAGGRLHAATDSTHGVPLSFVEAPVPQDGKRASCDAATVSGLDHVVIRTPNPERAVALYAGRLGLSLRLDRSEPSWGARLLFFRCGDLVVEIAHDLNAGIGEGNDSLWGLSWRVPDISVAHARLKAAGLDMSEVRTGRRPGSKVFTVRTHTAGVPTIMIGMTG